MLAPNQHLHIVQVNSYKCCWSLKNEIQIVCALESLECRWDKTWIAIHSKAYSGIQFTTTSCPTILITYRNTNRDNNTQHRFDFQAAKRKNFDKNPVYIGKLDFVAKVQRLIQKFVFICTLWIQSLYCFRRVYRHYNEFKVNYKF